MPVERDPRLQRRIVVTIVLLAILPFAFVYTFVFAANTIGIALLEWATERPWPGEFYVDPVVLAVVVGVGIVLQLRYGDRGVLSSIGARRVTREEYPGLHARLVRLAWQADLPPPAIAIAHNDAPNAFAVGGVGTRPTVVVTTGLLETLEEDQLDAVLAHELAHIGNRDADVMTVAWLLPTITYYLAIAAAYVLYGLYRILGASSGSGSRDGRAIVVAFVVVTVTALVTLAISAMFWFGSVLIHRVLSRYREFAADRAAAATTGDPLALATALETIDGEMSSVPDRDLRQLDGGVEALYLAPLEPRSFDEADLVSTDIFPETHPPTRERIDQLREIAGEEL